MVFGELRGKQPCHPPTCSSTIGDIDREGALKPEVEKISAHFPSPESSNSRCITLLGTLK